MSAGTSPAIEGVAPPNMTFSAAPCRRSLAMVNGPGPFQPAMAWLSCPRTPTSDTVELTIRVRALLSAMPRLSSPVGSP